MNVPNCLVLAAAVTISLAGGAAAQPPAGGQKIDLAGGLQRAYAAVKTNLTEAAVKLPDADYGYRPSPDIRPYGGQLAHVANAQFGTCAAAKGEPNPNGTTNLETTKTTRDDIIKALADSFTYCDPVFASLTDQTALAPIRQGQNEIARGAALANLIAHSNEEYGIVTVYLRTKGIVPPSTERAGRGRAGGMAPAAPAPGR